MRKDAYFDSIVPCYPDPRPPAGASAVPKLIPLAVWVSTAWLWACRHECAGAAIRPASFRVQE